MRMAVVADSWKKRFFKKVLDENGIAFSVADGPTTGTITISFVARSAEFAKPLIQAANTQAARSKG